MPRKGQKRKRKEERDETLADTLADALNGLVIPPLQALVADYVELSSKRKKELKDIMDSYTDTHKVVFEELDQQTQGDLLLFLPSLMPQHPRNSVLPFRSNDSLAPRREPKPKLDDLVKFREIQLDAKRYNLTPHETALNALSSGSMFLYRHFGLGDWNVKASLGAIFNRRFQVTSQMGPWLHRKTDEEMSELFWYYTDISSEMAIASGGGDDATQRFWRFVFRELLIRARFEMAQHWIEDEFFNYFPPQETNRWEIVSRVVRGINFNALHPNWRILANYIHTLRATDVN